MSDPREIVETLRLSRGELTALMEMIRTEAATHEPADVSHRRTERISYHIKCGLLIQVQHPGGSNPIYRVHPMDISEHGLGFLHGQFLFPGTRCNATLQAGDGERLVMSSRVVHCKVLRGLVHHVGIEFDHAVDPELFTDDIVTPAAAHE